MLNCVGGASRLDFDRRRHRCSEREPTIRPATAYDPSVNEWWNTNSWWLDPLGWVVGAAGLVYGVWARSHPKKTQLQITVKQQELGVPDDPRLEVRLDGAKVGRPTLVQVVIEHMGGPDIAAEDVPTDGITVSADKLALVGPLLSSATKASLDIETATISLRPYLIGQWTVQRIDYLADGPAKYTPHLRIANAEQYRKTWVQRVPDLFAYAVLGSYIAAYYLLVVPGVKAVGWGDLRESPHNWWIFLCGMVAWAAAAIVIARRRHGRRRSVPAPAEPKTTVALA